MSEFLGNAGKVDKPEPIEVVKPIESEVDVTEDHFKESLRCLDILAASFEALGTKLARRKKKANLRVLKAILFETGETNKTFGKDEQIMLDMCRKIMYHRQIVEIFLMKAENEKFLKELKNG